MQATDTRIALVGYYGEGNFGDELMLRALVKRLIAHYAVSVIAYDVAPLWIEEEKLGVRIVKYAYTADRRQRLRSLLQIVQELRRTDIVVFGGGTFLFDNVAVSYRNMGSSLRIAMISRLFRKRVAHLGIGIGRLTTRPGQRIARFILRSADLITVRDDASLELARRMAGKRSHGIHRTTDLAYLQPHGQPATAWPDRTKGESLRIVFCGQEFHQRTDLRHSEATLSRILANCLDKIVDHFGAAIQFVPMRASARHDDNRFHRQVVDKMKRCERTTILAGNGNRYRNTLRALNEADLIVGMRLHSLVAALAAARPLFGLIQTQKVRQLMAESGLAEFSQEIDTIDNGDDLASHLAETIVRVNQGAYPDTQDYVMRQRKLAERNIELLRALTNNHDMGERP